MPESSSTSPTARANRPVSDADAESFQAVRPQLLRIATRILGATTHADDVVQETWVRWQRTDRSEVRHHAAFLATATRRLAINISRSAHARRETCIGPRLPDPMDATDGPAQHVERRAALELAVRLLLETLSPAERAAYVLREAFDYPYRRIARCLGLSEANARQLVTRARRHLSDAPHHSVAESEQRRFRTAFVAAAETGDLATLERMLAADATVRTPDEVIVGVAA